MVRAASLLLTGAWAVSCTVFLYGWGGDRHWTANDWIALLVLGFGPAIAALIIALGFREEKR